MLSRLAKSLRWRRERLMMVDGRAGMVSVLVEEESVMVLDGSRSGVGVFDGR
jgi:hypothetical protein